MFSFLKKLKNPLPLLLMLAACSDGENMSTTTRTRASIPADGGYIFKKYCVSCHGVDGKLGMSGAKDLTQSTLTREERVYIITNGKNLMTPFRSLLTDKEIEAVAAFTETLKSK